MNRYKKTETIRLRISRDTKRKLVEVKEAFNLDTSKLLRKHILDMYQLLNSN